MAQAEKLKGMKLVRMALKERKTAVMLAFGFGAGLPYTLLIGTRDTLAIVRDPFACKPAIVAETDDYVAISSEYRSLAARPGV